MKKLFPVSVVLFYLFLTGCDPAIESNEHGSPITDPIQQLILDNEVTGKLNPFKLINNPEYTPVHMIDYIDDEELVFISKACGFVLVYPHRFMNVEVVNEESHGVLMAVTYCPITRSGIGWDRELGNDTLLLTASGYLLRDNLMPLDVNSGSIWSQMRLVGVSGEHNEMTINTLPLIETTWITVKKYFPEAGVFTNNGSYKSAESSESDNRGSFPKGQTFGIMSWNGVELFTLDMFPGEIKLYTTIVRPGGNVVVVGSSQHNYMAAFQTFYKMEPVEGEFPVIMKDETGTYWTIFGEAVNGERGGEKLESPVFYSAADWAWRSLFENISSYNPETK